MSLFRNGPSSKLSKTPMPVYYLATNLGTNASGETKLEYRLPTEGFGTFQAVQGAPAETPGEKFSLLRTLYPIDRCGAVLEEPCVEVEKDFGSNYFVWVQERRSYVVAIHRKSREKNHFQG